MKERLAELVRINGTKFNILFALICTLTAASPNQIFDTQNPSLITGLVALFAYVFDFWALPYKINIVLYRAFSLSQGRDGGRVWSALVGFGFLMRLLYRIFLLVIFLLSIGELQIAGGASWIARLVLIAGVLFELFVIFYSWVDPFDFQKDQKSELNKFYKRESARGSLKFQLKEGFADFVIFLTATLYTVIWWDMINQSFIDWIDGSSDRGGLIVIVEVLSLNMILCLVMLVPVRLVWWVGEAAASRTGQHQRGIGWSFLLAAVAMILPVLIHWFEVFVLC